jgi:sulfur relay protein TusB/DsrH
MLHILQIHLSQADFERLLELAQEDDAIVLMDDGVYNQTQLTKPHCPIYIMQSHTEMRGLVANHFTKPLDMAGLVELTTNHTKSVSW